MNTMHYDRTLILSDSSSGQLRISDNERVLICEEESLHDLTLHITIGTHASVVYQLQSNNLPTSQRRITFELAGEYAKVTCLGSYMLTGQQKYTLTIAQHHKAPYTESSVDLKMVLDGSCQASYKGMIIIEETGRKSTASQSHKALVVSASAQVTSEPKLEVLTSDVICNHGSAISYVNREHMHYLMSRGISENHARDLIIAGFLVD